MSDMNDLDIIYYTFHHSHTSGSTGYFLCQPSISNDLLLQLLTKRPLDTFLHNYAIQILLNSSREEVIDIINKNYESSPYLAALFLEYLALLQDPDAEILKLKASLEKIANEINPNSPLSCLWEEKLRIKRKLAKAVKDNLDCFQSLPAEVMPLITDICSKNDDLCPDTGNNNIIDEYARLKTAAPPYQRSSEIWQEATQKLQSASLLNYPEMRHEASLSPIALLREWPIKNTVSCGNKYILKGTTISYGRGLSLKAARASLYMEIIERSSAWADIEEDGKYYKVANRQKKLYIIKDTPQNLDKNKISFFIPINREFYSRWATIPFYWLEAENGVLVPVQAIFLFNNLDEPSIFDNGGSTGLGAGATSDEAKLSALLEIIERDSHATTSYNLDKCFIPASKDPVIQSLLNDYKFKNIYPIIQDITAETGVPAYRCFVIGSKIAQGTSADLNGYKAALSAITETPWPYSWAKPYSQSNFTRAIPNLPVRFLEDLPNYSLASPRLELELITNVLDKLRIKPIYIDITRKDLGFSVYRAFLPNLQTHTDFDELNMPPVRLLKKYLS